MWCRDCHREVDVKAAGSACPVCGRALIPSTRQTDDIRRAYEILERWQSSDLFERISTTAPLATFKQQDRAPLLNIPLGKPTAQVTEPTLPTVADSQNHRANAVAEDGAEQRVSKVMSPGTGNQSIPRELLEPSREFVGVPTAATGSGRKEQLIWDLLVSPTPLMANVIPPRSDLGQSTSGAVVPPTLVAGVSERPLPGSRAASSRSVSAVIVQNRDSDKETKTAPAEVSESVTTESKLIKTGVSDAPGRVDSTQQLLEHSDLTTAAEPPDYGMELRSELEPQVETAPDESPTDGEWGPTSSAGDDSSHVDESNTVNFESMAAQDSSAELELAKSERAVSDDFSHLENLFAVLAQKEFSQPATVPSSVETRSLPAHLVSSSAEQTATSSEVAQTVLPVLMSSASVHEEPASLEFKSAESANVSKQSDAETTKKTQRSAIRRPPLHRRFQLERPVSESSAGTEAVTRKLRLDQTGGNAESSQAREPVTSLPSSVAPETRIVSNSPMPGKRFRIDKAESVEEMTDTAGQRSRTHGRPRQRYIDEAHESQMRGPHFEVSSPKRSNLTSMTGQFLAYLGVLGLTVGTAMVIYGHFGGYSEITPTGWLVTTVAQMLLFLGVINLVSGGIEQNNDDVSRRINTLGEQLMRIEQVTSEVMRGPKIPAHMYAEDRDADEVMESAQETAVVKR